MDESRPVFASQYPEAGDLSNDKLQAKVIKPLIFEVMN